jgi:FecR protein
MENRQLIMLFADGEASTQEAARAEELLRQSPAMREAYAEIIRQRVMIAELLCTTGKKNMLPATHRLKSNRVWGMTLSVAAALLLIGVGLGWGLRGPLPAGYLVSAAEGPAASKPLDYGSRLISSDQESVEAMLEDNSVLSVSPAGKVRLLGRRQVELEDGELRVVCRKDPQRKFTVKVGSNTVTALGTEFVVDYRAWPGRTESLPGSRAGTNVKMEERKMKKLVRVMVITGVVILANQFGQVRLEAGEHGSGGSDSKPAKTDKGKYDDKENALGAEDLKNLGDFVQKRLREGLRGKDLADAIQEELKGVKSRKRARNGKGEGKGKGKGEGKGQGKGKGQGAGKCDDHGQGHAKGENKQHQKKIKERNKEGNKGEGKGKGKGQGKGKGKGECDDQGDCDGHGHKDKDKDKNKDKGKGKGQAEGDGGGKGRGQGQGGGRGKGKGQGKGQGNGQGNDDDDPDL